MDREGALEALERALSLGADGEVKDLVVRRWRSSPRGVRSEARA